MEPIIDLATVARWLALKKNKMGLYINPSRGLDGCLEAGLVVARYFLQEMGLSSEIAQVVDGSMYPEDLWFSPGIREPETACSSLGFDHLAVFPMDNRQQKWCLVYPEWTEVPQQGVEPLQTVVLPLYNVHMALSHISIHYPLYETVILALQACLFERIRQEMRGILADFIALMAQPESDEETAELQYLALPSVLMLGDCIPCLGRQSADEQGVLNQGSMFEVSNGRVMFRRDMVINIWEAYYATSRGWEEVSPLAATPPPFPQLLARLDFLTIFHQTIPVILMRQFREIEARILQVKQKGY